MTPAKFFKKYKGRRMTFAELPIEAQNAVAAYSQGCCEPLPKDKEELTDLMNEVRKTYRRGKFGLVVVPIEDLKALVLERSQEIREAFPTFAEYHAWYIEQGVPVHKTVWPCLLGDVTDELFQDGWHRFHSYVKAGLKEVPVLLYPGF